MVIWLYIRLVPNSWSVDSDVSGTLAYFEQIPPLNSTSVYDGDSFNYWYDSISTYRGYRCESQDYVRTARAKGS